MADVGQELTPLGRMLEDAREALRLSKREAAKRAGISDARWRQVVTGTQRTGRLVVKSHPRRDTVVAMARAVGVDPNQALKTAGFAELPALPPAVGGQPAPVTEEQVREWGDGVIEMIWAHPRLTDDQKQELTAQTRAKMAELLAIEERLRRTA